MYTIGRSLVMVLWKQCLRQGVACSCDKNNNFVARFSGSIYHVSICYVRTAVLTLMRLCVHMYVMLCSLVRVFWNVLVLYPV